MNARSAAAIDFETLTPEGLRQLFRPPAAGPCLSLYLPTHRNVPDSSVDRPTYRQLVEALELTLGLTRSRDEIERLLHPFRVLDGDRHFWEHTRDGLAILAAAGRARGYLVQRPVKPLALVGDHFHLLPLVRLVAAHERFTLLTLTSREAAVYEGTAWHDTAAGPSARDVTVGPLDPLPLETGPGGEPLVALSRDAVVDEEIQEPHRVFLGRGPSGRAATRVVHGGVGFRRDDLTQDTEIFLRHVDAVVEARVSRPTGLPLLLVAAGPLAATFRGLSANPLLLEEHVPLDPHLLTAGELAAAIGPLLAAAFSRRIARELRAYWQARERGLTAEDLGAIGAAAVAGRVAALLVEDERFVPGGFDRRTGQVAASGQPPGTGSSGHEQAASRAEDVLGALAETVLAHGGEIVSLARTAMPSDSGAAAILRY